MPAENAALTLIPEDPWRAAWFASWHVDRPGGIGDGIGDLDASGLTQVQIPLIVVTQSGATSRAERATVSARRIDLADAVEWLAGLEADETHHRSVMVWSRIARAALGVIAEGHLLPDVSPCGLDVWRCAPLDAAQERFIDAAAASLPAVAHAVPIGNGVKMANPRSLVRFFFDAVADVMVRTPAAAKVSPLRLFTAPTATPVPQLRTWAQDLAVAHAAPAVTVLRMIPPPVADEDTATGAKPGTDEQHEPGTVFRAPMWRVRFGLRGRVDPSLYIEAAELWTDPRSGATLFGAGVERVILAGVARACHHIEALNAAFDRGHPDEIEVDDATVEAILDSLHDLDAMDIDVLWPTSAETPTLQPRLAARARNQGQDETGPARFGLDALIDVDWDFLLEGSQLSGEELAMLANAKRSLVPLRGRWIRIDPHARKALAGQMIPAAARVVAAALGNPLTERELGLSDTDSPIDIAIDPELSNLLAPLINPDAGGLMGRTERSRLDQVLTKQSGAIEGIEAVLRPYQIEGVAWLSARMRLGTGGILADDMGLGKTLQVIAAAHHVGATAGSILVVCPTSLLNNWRREIERFAPGVKVRVYHGSDREHDELNGAGFTITTYGVVRSDLGVLATKRWDLVVADEAQAIKNPRSATAKSLRHLQASCRIALTGTPIENRLAELWSLLDWAVPGLLGPYERFRRTVALPIERDNDPDAVRTLRGSAGAFILRRTKADPGVAPDLPPKLERDVRVRLTDEQVSLYRAAADDAMSNVVGTDGITRRGRILALITALKQITNHPAHYLGETGPLPGRSAKLDALDAIVADARDSNQSVLVFTQYVAMAKLLRQHLDDRGVISATIDGSTPVSKRQTLVDAFQNGDIDVLVLSLKAAGTGLNLTAASVVVHFDRWWNPAVEDQASDRAYRIGQTKTVTVHRLISEGTIEDRVASLLDDKRELANLVLAGGESWVSELSDQELGDFVSLPGYGNDATSADDGGPAVQLELACRF